MTSRTDFLRTLFPDLNDEWIEVRVLPSRVQAFGTPGDPELEAFIQAHSDENVYFGVASRVEHDGTLEGDAQHCSRAWALWADLDFKMTPEGDVRALLAVCPTPPSIVLRSGGGLHAYWLLKDAVAADAALGSWLRRLALKLRADVKSAEPVRILRLPDTRNFGYAPPRLVVIEFFEPTRRYALSDFEWLPEEPAKPAATMREEYSIGVLDSDKVIAALATLWPSNGQRHEFALCLGGWLASRSVDQADAERIIHDAADRAQDDDPADRARAVRDTYVARADGQPVKGLARALTLVPALRGVVDGLTEALGIVPRPLTTADKADDMPHEEPDDLAFPQEARLGLAKQWADLYADAYEAPWANWYFSFLTHLGARVAKHLRLEDDLGTEPRLYTILLGASGIGKSEPMNKATADFGWADLGHEPIYGQPEPNRFKVIHGVGSGEAIASALEASDRRQVLLQPDEFSHVTQKAKIDGGTIIQILLALFERSHYDNRTKDKGYDLEGASLSFLTACVDTVFQTIFDPKGGADTGIITRFWVVAGPGSAEPKPIPRVNRVQLDHLRRALHRLLVPFQRMTVQQFVTVRMTPEAEALYRAWYREEYWPATKVDPSVARLRTYANRFIMLLALVTHAGDILLPGSVLTAGPEVVRAALAMMRWQRAVRQRHAPLIAETKEGKLEQMILRVYERAGEQGLNRRDAQRLANAHRGLGVAAWNRAFDALVHNGDLVPLNPGDRSERSLRYRLIPA